MAYPKYPPELKQQALTLLAEGKSSVNISKLLNVPPSTICTWGYSKSSTKKIPPSSIPQLIADYEKGISLAALEKQTGFNRKAISKILKDRGVDIASYGKRIQSVKHNPFADLSNPEVNYWLGLLAADGHILDEGVVRLSSIDLDILEKFATFTGCDKPLYGQGRVWTCGFMNKEVAEYLSALGITPRKSLTLDMQIPITADFMRGYWDGNGSFIQSGSGQITLQVSTGSFVFSNQLKDSLHSHKIGFSFRTTASSTYKYKGEIKPTAPHYTICIGRRIDCLNLFHLLYRDATKPSIDRKQNKAQDLTQILLDKEIV